MNRDLIVSTTPRETRVALLEDGVVSELFIEREAHRGDRRQHLQGPGHTRAARDAVGLRRHRPRARRLPARGRRLRGAAREPARRPRSVETRHARRPIEDKLHEGQEVVVQVLKEPMGTKGARITSHVSLPGRYLVLMPTVEHVGVSRKITEEDERRRLKTVLKEFRQERGGGGLIARTAGAGPRGRGLLPRRRAISRAPGTRCARWRLRQRAPVLLLPRAVAARAPAARPALGGRRLGAARQRARVPAHAGAGARARAGAGLARAAARRAGRRSSRSTASPPSWSGRCARRSGCRRAATS